MARESDQPAANYPGYLFPVLSGLVLYALVGSLWYFLTLEHEQNLQSTLKTRAALNSTLIQVDIENRLDALERIADRWQVRGGTPENEFLLDAGKYVQDLPGFQALEWVDQGFRVRWIAPLEGNEKAQDLNLAFEKKRLSALLQARDKRAPSISKPIELVQGGQGFHIYLPLFSNNRFDGFVLAVFRISTWMDHLLNKGAGKNHFETSMFVDGKTVYGPSEILHASGPGVQKTTVYALDQKLLIQVSPKPAFYSDNRTLVPEIALATGLVFATLVAFVIFLLQRSAEAKIILTNQARELDFQKRTLDKHAIVSIADANGNITYVNDTFCEIGEYTREELIGYNHRLLKSDEHSPEFYSNLWHTIGSGKPWQGEIKNRTKSGGYYWVKATIVPFMGEDGKPVQYVSIRTDITQQKVTEENLRRSEEKYRNSIDSTTEGYWLVDIDGRMLEVNKAFCNILGREQKELLGRRPPEFADEASRLVHEKNTADITSTEQRRYEVTFTSKSGRPVHTSISATTIRNADGEATGAFAFISDITEQKIAEMALRDSEEMFRGFYNVVPDIFIIVDMDSGMFVDVNDGFCSTMGFSRDETIGQTVMDLNIYVSPDDRTRLMTQLKNKGELKNYSLNFRSKNGPIWPAIVSAFVIQLNGRPHIVSSMKDASEIRRSQLEAEKANRAKSEFLSSMSHELRTPLNSILGFSQLLNSNSDEPLTEDQADSLNHIVNSGKHLLELVNDVLDLAGIESGKMEINIADVLPLEVMEESVSLVSTMAEDNNIQVIVSDRASRAPLVRADHVRFRQIMVNLLSNAIKYNRQGGQVTIDARDMPGGMLRLSVADTGNGIPADKQKDLFKPFSRLGAETTEIEGTGIGLVVCKDLTELMGGTIGLQSTVDEGSVFWFSLPLSEAALDSDLPSTTDPESPQSSASGFPEINARILYVEDNANNISLMKKVINRIPGLSMVTAPDGQTGLEMAQKDKPDVVILDINLPDISGIDVLKRLAEDEATKDIPALALSAAATHRDIESGLDAGFRHYLTKPVDINKLVDAVRDVLDLS